MGTATRFFTCNDAKPGVWYEWIRAIPPRDATWLECKRGHGPSFALKLECIYPEFNVADLYWRDPV